VRLDPERLATSVVGIVKAAMVGVVDRLTAIEKRLDAMPTPKDGEPGPAGPVGETGPQGPIGPTGEKGADGIPGRDGMSVHGPQGIQGEKGLDGANGKDGRDGQDAILGNVKMTYDGRRTVTVTFKDGTPIEGGVWTLPIPLYEDVYKDGKSYQTGDSVTWGGSLYIAQKDTSAKPGQPSDDSRAWRLAVKKGADGKQGPSGPVGPQGSRGPEGPRGPQGF
jgi:collagen type III alpha